MRGYKLMVWFLGCFLLLSVVVGVEAAEDLEDVVDDRVEQRQERVEARKAELEAAREAREQAREEAKMARDEAMEEAKMEREEAMEERKELMEAKREALKDQIESRREEMKEEREQRREAFKQQLELIKDVRKAQIVERVDERLLNLNVRRTDHYSNVIEKMQVVFDRLQAVVNSAGTNGANTIAAQSVLDTASGVMDEAKAAVLAQADNDYTADISEDDELRTEVGAVFELLRSDLKTVHELLVDVRQLLADAAREVAKLRSAADPGVLSGDEMDSTSSPEIDGTKDDTEDEATTSAEPTEEASPSAIPTVEGGILPGQ